MASLSLNDVRNSIEKQYAHTEIDLGDGQSVILMNAMRLDDAKRSQLITLSKELRAESDKEDDEKASVTATEMLGKITPLIDLACDNPAKLHKAIEAAFPNKGDRLPAYTEIMSAWMEGTEVGEA